MPRLDEELLRSQLTNGLLVVVTDNSKTMAADRWYITLTCRAEIELPPKKLAALSMDSEMLAAFVAKTNGKLEYVFTKERNFIDEGLKDEAVAEFMGQIEEVTLPYLGATTFVDRLFEQKVEEFSQEYKVRQEIGLIARDDEEEDDGPADFSACFKD